MPKKDCPSQDNTAERRRFQRIAFTATADIHQGDTIWPVTIIDISFKGALTTKPASWDTAVISEAPITINITIDKDKHIEFTGTLKHAESDKLGFHCEDMALDSATTLRRLVELNLGDPALLERELSMLVSSD